MYQATYNPDAEAHAQENKEAAKQAKEEKAAKEAAAAQQQKDAAQKAAAEKAEKDRAERETFSGGRLVKRVFTIVGIMVLIFVVFVLAILGASFATNLNLHRELPYRILYAIYGFAFFWIVVPYVVGYRWFWLGKAPMFYGIIPLLPYQFDSPLAEVFLGWMSYKPDARIQLLEEWHNEILRTLV